MPRPETAETARDQLRRATAETHSRLHADSAFSRLMSGSLTLAQYRLLLSRLYGFHAALETRLRSVPPQWCYGMDPLAVAKSRLLGADLAALNVSAPQIAVLPICTRLSAIGSAGAFIGCAYVIEGAALGGRVIAQRLAPLLGFEVEGRRFFLGDTASDPSPWSRCCAAVEQCAADGHIEAMVLAAANTFLSLEHWLDEEPDDASIA